MREGLIQAGCLGALFGLISINIILGTVMSPNAASGVDLMNNGKIGILQREKILDMHNSLRSYEATGGRSGGAAYMLRMVYDMGLESYAKNYSKKLCSTGHWGHSNREPPMRVAPGENLYVNSINYSNKSPLEFDPGEVVKKWWDERQYFNWDSPNPHLEAQAKGQMIGHYTQVVRAEASAVGCWIVTGCECPKNANCRKENNPPYWSTYMVCHYDFGNRGWFPYWPVGSPANIPSWVPTERRVRCGNCPRGFNKCGTTGGGIGSKRDAHLCVGFWDRTQPLPPADLLKQSLTERNSKSGVSSWAYMIRHCINNGGCPVAGNGSEASYCWLYNKKIPTTEPRVIFQQCICRNFNTNLGHWFNRDTCASQNNSTAHYSLRDYGVSAIQTNENVQGFSHIVAYPKDKQRFLQNKTKIFGGRSIASWLKSEKVYGSRFIDILNGSKPESKELDRLNYELPYYDTSTKASQDHDANSTTLESLSNFITYQMPEALSRQPILLDINTHQYTMDDKRYYGLDTVKLLHELGFLDDSKQLHNGAENTEATANRRAAIKAKEAAVSLASDINSDEQRLETEREKRKHDALVYYSSRLEEAEKKLREIAHQKTKELADWRAQKQKELEAFGKELYEANVKKNQNLVLSDSLIPTYEPHALPDLHGKKRQSTLSPIKPKKNSTTDARDNGKIAFANMSSPSHAISSATSKNFSHRRKAVKKVENALQRNLYDFTENFAKTSSPKQESKFSLTAKDKPDDTSEDLPKVNNQGKAIKSFIEVQTSSPLQLLTQRTTPSAKTAVNSNSDKDSHVDGEVTTSEQVTEDSSIVPGDADNLTSFEEAITRDAPLEIVNKNTAFATVKEQSATPPNLNDVHDMQGGYTSMLNASVLPNRPGTQLTTDRVKIDLKQQLSTDEKGTPTDTESIPARSADTPGEPTDSEAQDDETKQEAVLPGKVALGETQKLKPS